MKNNKQELAEKWIEKNGACKFDFKKRSIHLFNGGLFEDMDKNYAVLWMRNLDSTINYLIRMKKFLNALKINTNIETAERNLNSRK